MKYDYCECCYLYMKHLEHSPLQASLVRDLDFQNRKSWRSAKDEPGQCNEQMKKGGWSGASGLTNWRPLT